MLCLPALGVWPVTARDLETHSTQRATWDWLPPVSNGPGLFLPACLPTPPTGCQAWLLQSTGRWGGERGGHGRTHGLPPSQASQLLLHAQQDAHLLNELNSPQLSLFTACFLLVLTAFCLCCIILKNSIFTFLCSQHYCSLISVSDSKHWVPMAACLLFQNKTLYFSWQYTFLLLFLLIFQIFLLF